MWRYYADLYCGIVRIKTGGKMNLRATLVKILKKLKKSKFIWELNIIKLYENP